MHSLIPYLYVDVLDRGARDHLNHLTNKDYVKVIEYLSEVLADKFGIAFSLIRGPFRTRKTYLIS